MKKLILSVLSTIVFGGMLWAQTPVVLTSDFANLTKSQVTLGGNVTSQGGTSVTDRGIVYSTKNSNPKIGGEGVTKWQIGSGTGSYSSNLTGLTGVKKYFYRAYATNSSGTSYGETKSFLVRDSRIRGLDYDNWEEVSGMSIGGGALPTMTGHAVTYFDNNIYVVGRYTHSAEVLVFNGENWSYGTSLPSARRNASAVEYNGFLYKMMGTIDGGTSISNRTLRLSTGSWSNLGHNVSDPTVTTAMVTFNDKIYALGGYSSAYRNWVKEYNGTTWTDITSTDALPSAVTTHHNAVVYNGRIYITGQGSNRDKVYSYDGTGTSGNKWQSETDLPSNMAHIHSTVIFEDRIHTIGGTNHFSWAQGDANWTIKAAFPQNLYRTGGGVIGEHIFIIGGSIAGSTSSADFRNTVYRFPALTSGISPASGSITGNYTVTISGTWLTNGSTGDITSVKLAGLEVAGIISASTDANGNSTIVVTAAATATAVTGDVVIVSNAFGTITKTNAFTYEPILPFVSTEDVNGITPFDAASGGSISNNGGAPITARGVVWSTSSNPTLQSNTGLSNDGTGTGTYFSSLSTLNPNTFYYVRAYATNSAGTAYGNQLSFTTLPECTNPTTGGGIGSAQNICSGTIPALLTEITTPGGSPVGTLEYQWQSSTTSDVAGFANILNATSSTYQAGSLTQTTWYKRLVKVDCESVWVSSNVIEVAVITGASPAAGSISITSSGSTTPGDWILCSGRLVPLQNNPSVNVSVVNNALLAGNLIIEAETSITIDADIAPTLTAARDLTLQGASIAFTANGFIRPTGFASNIFLTANALSLHTDSRLQSSGNLTIKPYSVNTTIGITGVAGTLQLAATYFTTNFVTGFNLIEVGSVDAGDITIGSINPLRDNYVFRSGGKVIQTGSLTFGIGTGHINTLSEITMISPSEIRLNTNIQGRYGETDGRSVSMTFDAPAIVLTNTVFHFAIQALVHYKGTVDSDGTTPRNLSVSVHDVGSNIIFEKKIGSVNPLGELSTSGLVGHNVHFKDELVKLSGKFSSHNSNIRLFVDTQILTNGYNIENGSSGTSDFSGANAGLSLSLSTVNAAETSAGTITLGPINNSGGHYLSNITLNAKPTNGTAQAVIFSSVSTAGLAVRIAGDITISAASVEPRYYTHIRDLEISTNKGLVPGNINLGETEIIGLTGNWGGPVIQLLANSVDQAGGNITLKGISGKNASTGNPDINGIHRVTIDASGTSNGTITLHGDVYTGFTNAVNKNNNLSIKGDLNLVRNTIIDNSAGTGTLIIGPGNLNGNFDLTLNSSGAATLNATVGGTTSLANFSMEGSSLVQNNAISANKILLGSKSGNITLKENLTAGSDAADAIVVVADKNREAGDATGGNIIITGSPTITTGSGGVVRFYTGSVSASTGIASLLTNPLNIRYNSNINSTLQPAITTGGLYAIYREKPASVTWTGIQSSAWTSFENWSPAFIPLPETNVTIPAVVNPQFNPQIDSGTDAGLNNLTITAGGKLTVKNGGRLTINGQLSLDQSNGAALVVE